MSREFYLFVDVSKFALYAFQLFLDSTTPCRCISKCLFQFGNRSVFMLLDESKGLCHLLQICNFDLLRISTALLCFDAVFQINNKTYLCCGMSLLRHFGMRCFSLLFRTIIEIIRKYTEKIISVISRAEHPSRDWFFTVGNSIAIPTSLVTDRNAVGVIEHFLKFFKGSALCGNFRYCFS